MSDSEGPANRRLPYWLIGLLAVVLGAIVLALPPGRQMLDQIGFESVGPAPQNGPLTTLRGSPDRAMSTSFDIDRDLLVVELPVRPDSGILVAKAASGSMGQILIADATGNEVIEVFPTGLLVRNTEGSAAYYQLAVPRQVTQVEVRVAGIMLARLPAPRGLEWEVELASGPHTLGN